MYPGNLSHSDLARHLKARSSKWIHESMPKLRGFAWQNGYGGFTVSKSVVPQVVRYVERQKEHHKKMSFEDEFMTLLAKHGIRASREDVFE